MSIVENKSSFRAACIQLNSYRSAEENMDNIVKLFDFAVKNDSDFVTLPGVAGMMEPNTALLKQKVVYQYLYYNKRQPNLLVLNYKLELYLD